MENAKKKKINLIHASYWYNTKKEKIKTHRAFTLICILFKNNRENNIADLKGTKLIDTNKNNVEASALKK